MFHVNPATGESRKCGAKSPESCPFGAENHYNSKTESDAAGEVIVEQAVEHSGSMAKSTQDARAAALENRDGGFMFHSGEEYSEIDLEKDRTLSYMGTIEDFYENKLDAERAKTDDLLDRTNNRMREMLGNAAGNVDMESDARVSREIDGIDDFEREMNAIDDPLDRVMFYARSEHNVGGDNRLNVRDLVQNKAYANKLPDEGFVGVGRDLVLKRYDYRGKPRVRIMTGNYVASVPADMFQDGHSVIHMGLDDERAQLRGEMSNMNDADLIDSMNDDDKREYKRLNAYRDVLIAAKTKNDALAENKEENVKKLRDNRHLIEALTTKMSNTRRTGFDTVSQHRNMDRLNEALRNNGHGDIRFSSGDIEHGMPDTEIIAINSDDSYVLRHHSDSSYMMSDDPRAYHAGDTVSIQVVNPKTGERTVSRAYGKLTGPDADRYVALDNPNTVENPNMSTYNDIPEVYRSIIGSIDRETIAMTPTMIPRPPRSIR